MQAVVAASLLTIWMPHFRNQSLSRSNFYPEVRDLGLPPSETGCKWKVGHNEQAVWEIVLDRSSVPGQELSYLTIDSTFVQSWRGYESSLTALPRQLSSHRLMPPGASPFRQHPCRAAPRFLCLAVLPVNRAHTTLLSWLRRFSDVLSLHSHHRF